MHSSYKCARPQLSCVVVCSTKRWEWCLTTRCTKISTPTTSSLRPTNASFRAARPLHRLLTRPACCAALGEPDTSLRSGQCRAATISRCQNTSPHLCAARCAGRKKLRADSHATRSPCRLNSLPDVSAQLIASQQPSRLICQLSRSQPVQHRHVVWLRNGLPLCPMSGSHVC